MPSHEQLAKTDWNPNALYYVERKGIAYSSSAGIQFPRPQLKESVTILSPEEKHGATVIV